MRLLGFIGILISSIMLFNPQVLPMFPQIVTFLLAAWILLGSALMFVLGRELSK